jgi:hypothetical protein
MQPNDENYFLKLSNWSDELVKVEGRIAAWVKQESFPDLDSEDDDSSEPIEDGGHRSKRQQLRFRVASRGEQLSSLYERRDSLLLEFQRVYLKFAQERFDNIEELREPSPLGELFAQCAFAVGATLESFFSQFENLVDHNNSTVETLLTLSEELEFADQSRGDQEPLVGLGVVHLADEGGHTCGIRAGDKEAKFINGICAREDFTNNLASMIRQSTERILDHETQLVVERVPFSVNGDREHVYGASSRPDSRVAQVTSTFWPNFGIQETVHYPMVPVDWTTEKREAPEKPDSLFWRVVSTNNYLKQLTSEARMITDHFDSLGRRYPDTESSVGDMDGTHEEAPAVDPAFEELECIKVQIHELKRELEPAFLELAATELAPIETSASELSQESIRDSCRAAVEAIITR